MAIFMLATNADSLVQAGKRKTGSLDFDAQLQVWEDAAMVPHIDPVRLQMYEVLGGQLQNVLPSLQLPWRLAFGMHLW
jgi:Nuclear protein 96